MWWKPVELFKDEYETTVSCLKNGLFKVTRDNEAGKIIVYRKDSSQPILIHFFPHSDTINYNKENEEHTYYQTGDIFSDEYKEPEELPRKIVLEDQETVQKFLNEVIRLQKEYSDNSEEE